MNTIKYTTLANDVITFRIDMEEKESIKGFYFSITIDVLINNDYYNAYKIDVDTYLKRDDLATLFKDLKHDALIDDVDFEIMLNVIINKLY